MNIIRAETIAEVLECIPIEMKIREKEDESIKLKDMLTFLESQINLPYLGFYIAYEETKIVGFLILFYVPIRGMEEIRIVRIWHELKYDKVMEDFINIIKHWQRETKTKRVTAEMDAKRKGKSNMGRIRALNKKWGFHIKRIVIERSN